MLLQLEGGAEMRVETAKAARKQARVFFSSDCFGLGDFKLKRVIRMAL